jgi:Isopropylmalate/homocitrate/citramalate synthases
MMAAAVTESVIINEVGPRDGLQSQGKTLAPRARLALIEHLVGTGLRHVEAGSFVSPKAVPQMAGTDEVFHGLPSVDRVRYAALVPNMKGYELAVAAGARVVNVVLSVTETMNYENIRRTVDESAADFEQIIERASAEGITAQAYLAVAFECPFEGPVNPEVVRRYAERMSAAGAGKIIIADTIGAANPKGVQAVLAAVSGVVPLSRVACHFHDTRGHGTGQRAGLAQRRGCASLMPPLEAWAAARSHRGQPAMWRPRTWPCCWIPWAMTPALSRKPWCRWCALPRN